MSRLALLLVALGVFVVTPGLLERFRAMPPSWRVRLGFLSLVGTAATTAALLAAILFPEALVVRSVRELWEMCARAFTAILENPLVRLPSLLAGAALSLMLGRFAWALARGMLATRRALVRGGAPQFTLSGGQPVHLLPLTHPEAYSVGSFRGQVVVSRGLLDLLDEQERRAVLLHEEGHLKARHQPLLLVARALARALPPLPRIRHALAMLEQAVEEAADRYAAENLGTGLPVAGSLSKAALAGLERPVAVLSLIDGPDVPSRIRKLLAPDEVRPWVSSACFVALVLLLGLLAVTQAIGGLAVLAAAHHVAGFGTALTCPLR